MLCDIMQRYCKHKHVMQLFVSGLCLLILLLNSCSVDNIEVLPGRKPEEIALKFSVKLPGSQSSMSVTTNLPGVNKHFVSHETAIEGAFRNDQRMLFLLLEFGADFTDEVEGYFGYICCLRVG